MSWITNIEAAMASGSSSVITETATLFGTMSSKANGYLTTIMANYTDSDVVKDQVTKLKEVANLPPGVGALASAIPAAAAAATTDVTKITGLTSIISAIKGLL